MNIETNCFLFGHQAEICLPAKSYYGFNRFCYVKKGGTVYHDDDHDMPIEEGYFYLFPVKSYWFESRPEGGYDHIWGHILIKGFQFNRVIKVDPKDYDMMPYFLQFMEKIILENTGPKIEENKFKLWYIITSDNPYFPVLNHLTCALIDIIYLKINQDNNFSDSLQRIINYINFNLDKDLSNDHLAKIAMYHKNYFIQKFTEEFDMPPQKYVLKARISEAILMLMNDIKIQDIAFRLGYDNAKSFSRAFKREVGIAPLDYKNTHYYGIKC